jgi:hypothetical protein
MKKHLNDYVNLLPYPEDMPTRFAFIVADLIAATIILGIAYIVLKTTLHW